MKKNLLLLSLMFSVSVFGQSEGSKSKTMGFYISPNVQIGYNLGNSIKENQNRDSPYYQENVAPYLPNDFTYGIGVVGGYHLLPFFALGTGLKYNYVSDNLHLLNWTIQPKFIIGKDEGKFVVEFEYGKQFNNSNISNTHYFGGKLGYQESFSKRLIQEGGLFIYRYNSNVSNSYFIGLSVSAIIFSNKKYTVYGED
ncbi:hypothetical protein LUD75_00815 [Epilithonimonas sp. JDS]|uniref:hypothetical protein n=1 Tax=Epilithonimonas sp. JDS TaxID=2902797 RepID=UPI001E2BBA90|nr:hypothetical protein [Epilithonimonas sp. JDS]MCD9853230.1 hypothetical protein [Epilithonimonas sp. JDS]